MLVILQVYRNFFNIFTKQRETPECFSGRFSLLYFYSLVKKENIGLKWNKDIKIRYIIPESSFKIWKILNILKPKNVILCRLGSRITVNLKLNICFPINHFPIIVRPPPCTARCVLGCADISYVTSGSVAVDRHLNAASKKENNTEECPYIFSSDVS